MASISQDDVAEKPPPAVASDVGTFMMTTAAGRQIETVDDVPFETAPVPTGSVQLSSERSAELTQEVVAMVEPVSPALWEAVLGTPMTPVSWEEAVAFAVALAEKMGVESAYELGEWTPRKDWHVADMGRLLYDVVHFDRIPAVLATFGDRTLDVLQFTPERLAEVEGIGPKTAAKIGASWDRTLCYTRKVTRRDNGGWRLPSEIELAALGTGGWEWTDDADPGPAWSEIAEPLPDVIEPDRRVFAGPRRVVRSATERRALRAEAREESVRFRLVM